MHLESSRSKGTAAYNILKAEILIYLFVHITFTMITLLCPDFILLADSLASLLLCLSYVLACSITCDDMQKGIAMFLSSFDPSVEKQLLPHQMGH
jgi:hypothetical protein